MSKNDKTTQNTEQEKVITKYDRKMQRREQQKQKEKKDKLISTIVGVVIVAALACWVISLPLRTYFTLHGTYVNIGGEDITKVEFDYNYYQVQSNYISQNSALLSYYGGIDTENDFSQQIYSGNMTWGDYFQELTVDNIIRSKSLKAEADAAGFTYDTAEEFEKYTESVKEAASLAGVSEKEYLKQLYGPYATMDRISGYVKEAMVVTAYYEQVMEQKAPTEEEIQAYYNENQASYDSVDYRVKIINAELPTEPTELADPVEETDEGAGEDSEEKAYVPSEAEVAKAMADARELADKAESTIGTDGELKENIRRMSMVALIRDWLFDDSRKAGDTTVLEDTNGNKYYVLSFVKRYLDQTPSADLRVVMLEDKSEQEAQDILNEWKNGNATEEGFADLCEKYSMDTVTEGGLYKEIIKTGMQEKLASWIFAKERAAGDTEIVQVDETHIYVMYYVGANSPEWKLEIKNTLTTQNMTAYIEEISADCEVKDTKGNLKYIEIRAQEEAAAQASAEAAGTESGEQTEASGESDDEESSSSNATQASE